jgi:hypothetical protein
MTDEQTIAARNAARALRAKAALDVLTAVAIGLAFAALLVAYLTPCATATLCMGAVMTPTRVTLWARLRAPFMRWYLQRLISSAEYDLQVLQQDITFLPRRLEMTRLHISALQVQLIDIDLSTRRN